MIVGRDGLLVAGANAKQYEAVLTAYLSLLCREMFIRNFFTRTFVMDDLLKKIRVLILGYQQDPNNIARIRLKLNDGSRDIILLKEVLEYLSESLEASLYTVDANTVALRPSNSQIQSKKRCASENSCIFAKSAQKLIGPKMYGHTGNDAPTLPGGSNWEAPLRASLHPLSQA